MKSDSKLKEMSYAQLTTYRKHIDDIARLVAKSEIKGASVGDAVMVSGLISSSLHMRMPGTGIIIQPGSKAHLVYREGRVEKCALEQLRPLTEQELAEAQFDQERTDAMKALQQFETVVANDFITTTREPRIQGKVYRRTKERVHFLGTNGRYMRCHVTAIRGIEEDQIKWTAELEQSFRETVERIASDKVARQKQRESIMTSFDNGHTSAIITHEGDKELPAGTRVTIEKVGRTRVRISTPHWTGTIPIEWIATAQ